MIRGRADGPSTVPVTTAGRSGAEALERAQNRLKDHQIEAPAVAP